MNDEELSTLLQDATQALRELSVTAESLAREAQSLLQEVESVTRELREAQALIGILVAAAGGRVEVTPLMVARFPNGMVLHTYENVTNGNRVFEVLRASETEH